VTGPCPTCRQEVEHLIALNHAITDLRAKHRTHRSVRGVLAHFIDTAGKVARRHRQHRLDEHRAAIRDLAQHLTDHAEGRAA
jgi:hypothetical protein